MLWLDYVLTPCRLDDTKLFLFAKNRRIKKTSNSFLKLFWPLVLEKLIDNYYR